MYRYTVTILFYVIKEGSTIDNYLSFTINIIISSLF